MYAISKVNDKNKYMMQFIFQKLIKSSHLGVEPRTFGFEVQRTIHCANNIFYVFKK